MRTLKLAISAAVLFTTTSAFANHPVLLEGNCLVPPPGSATAVPAGTCGDYDGDGRIGRAEDQDGDRVFGTINGALGPGGTTGANQNGAITVVTSGVFAEMVRITASMGNVTLQAAPGVEAIIDAVLQGDATGNERRQGQPGIIVFAPADRQVILRNLTIRNWNVGIQVDGRSVVTIENSRLENNVRYGVLVGGSARVKIDESSILATGYRMSTSGNFPTDNPPDPGNGVEFENSSSGAIFRTEISGSFRTGINDESSGSVQLQDVYLFNNRPDTTGVSEQ